MAERKMVEPDVAFIKKVRKSGGDALKNCYQCATCSVVCDLSPDEKPFPRKEMLWTQWGLKDKLVADPDVWLCHQCNDCSTHCPRGAKPGDVLAAIRAQAIEYFSFPNFMGKAVNSPKALPVLLLVPIVLMLGILFYHTGGDFSFFNEGEVEFAKFFPHNLLEPFFILGNIIIFAFATIGFLKFWKMMKVVAPPTSNTIGIVPSFIATVKELITHEKFNKCTVNKPRATAHLLIIYGFAGAMVATAIVVLGTVFFHFLPTPIDLPNPVKILGALSGVSMIIGGSMLVVRRSTAKDEVGAGGYFDTMFLYMVYFVAITGMLTYFSRLTGIPSLAYIVYFIHLVFVFFLLWYMPYSKFSHMIYRFLAIMYTKSAGRDKTAK